MPGRLRRLIAETVVIVIGVLIADLVELKASMVSYRGSMGEEAAALREEREALLGGR